MKKWIWMITVLTAIAVLAACGNQGETAGTNEETVTVKDMLNKDGVKIKKNPKKSSSLIWEVSIHLISLVST